VALVLEKEEKKPEIGPKRTLFISRTDLDLSEEDGEEPAEIRKFLLMGELD
jgi:hypothetical protein